MSLTVKTNELLEALQQTIKVIPSRSTLPILGCAYFDFTEEHVKIRSTNLETSISVSINYKGEQPEEPITIPINRLLEITANIKDENMDFDFTKYPRIDFEDKYNIVNKLSTF